MLRLAALAALGSSVCVPAFAQPGGCNDSLKVDATTLCITFVPEVPSERAVVVRETFSAGGKTVAHDVTFDIMPGAKASRTIDDVDISALVPGRSLHTTLKYASGKVTLDRVLLLPGAIPLR